MASYDYQTAKAYVLEAGDYEISIRSDSHTVIASDTYTVNSTVVYDESNPRNSDDVAATNQFDDVHGYVTYLSRANGFANYAEATAAPATLEMPADQVATYELNANYDYEKYIDPSDEMPTTGAQNGMKLAQLRGKDYDDPDWDKLLDQLSVQDMLDMTSLCGYQTPAVESVGKVQTNDADGPGSINNNFSGAGSLGFPSVSVIASTWSKDLVHQYGYIMGKMAKELDVAGWYAPGMNIHRYPFGGRNYEYYSEDPILTGLLTGNAVAGAASEGVYAYIKHLALYDGNYKMVCIWSNEQAIREIYLKPFEICVKQFGANAVMASWNYLGTTWAGESSAMMNTVLRDEWGFRGMVESDYFRDNGHGFMNADAALANGMDAMLSTYGAGPNLPHDAANPSASTVKYLRTACKNIMYVVVNSWEYETDVNVGGMPSWQKMAIGIDVAAGVVLAALEALIIKTYSKKSKKEQ
ncbi:glycoside hydrolase family 3 N-terminal domain-containing protein [Pseudoflavonifractor sp. 60]|uniref:glycoside hydrolase family 3 N-terminal domain-containing protein n=1 Tax=Pseudoflavonifractor sp. 60 TaxID=2304576 RepID=UPI001FAE6D3D|nr:glycoside hydrolase family 3 N-terminal domain-containing protein [Pseudoflavonifractor sp. 60]